MCGSASEVKQAIETRWFKEGHDFSRAVSAAELMRLQPLRATPFAG
jgi:hypothetical protein